MKIFCLILFTYYFSSNGFSQIDNVMNMPITIELQNVSIKDAINKICKINKLDYVVNSQLKDLSKTVSLSFKGEKLHLILDMLLNGTEIEYTLVNKQLIFKTKLLIKKNFVINGYAEDLNSHERLIGCVVIDSASRKWLSTNAFGYFSITIGGVARTLTFRYLGYVTKSVVFDVNEDTTIIVRLAECKPLEIKEVKIVNSLSEAKLARAQMGLMNINAKDVKKMPVLLGEADVMRALQTLPGIQAANERSTGISVRGGSIDQNLFLLDDAPVFQISHVGGFYSVFNNEAVKDIKVYKGDIPANYGGRLSSVVDIRLKDGNMKSLAVAGGIGIVATNLSIEGPILKDRISFIISGKTSYLGLLYKLMNPNINKLSFYDLNFKLNAIVNNKNRIYLSSYNGGDKFGNDLNSNKTLSVRWNHIYNPKFFSNISLINSNHSYKSGNTDNVNSYSYTWKSGLKQITLKAEYNYFLNSNNTIDFGVSTSCNNFIPGKLEGNKNAISSITQSIPFSNRVIEEQETLEHAFYFSNQQKLTDKLSLKYGIRTSLYQNLGRDHWVYKLDNYQVADSFYAAKKSIYANYVSIEPRISINYRLSQNSAIKGSYTYTAQQTQLLLKTNGGGPLDIWFPSGINIKPQTSSHYSLGYVQYLLHNLLEVNIEGYFKNMNNIIDYKDGATFLAKNSLFDTNKTSYNFEEQLRIGRGYAYGTEIVLKGGNNKIDGFVSYTYARSKRIIPDINFGKTYLSPFDKPHTLNVSLNWDLTTRVSLSTNFRFQSGQVTTIPIYVIEMWGKVLSGYSNRNEYRLPSYQRLDLSLTIKSKEKIRKRFRSEWNCSIINVLNHRNVEYLNFVPSIDTPSTITAKGVSILGIIPSVSYRFNF